MAKQNMLLFLITRLELSKGEKILESAGSHKRVVEQFCFTNCCPRRMEGKFQNVSTIFTKTAIHRGKIDLTADSRHVSVDGRKRYENGSVDADQLMCFR